MSSAPPASGAEAASTKSIHSTSGDASRENEMIGSLGEALAGVNLASGSVHQSNAFSFHREHDSGTPFNLNSQTSQNAPDLSGWGFHSDTNSRSSKDSKAPQAEPSTPKSMTGNQGIDLFLSQSPSQMLGNDVFKLSSNNLRGLEMPQEERHTDPFRQQPMGQASAGFQNSQGRKADSPSNLTGTSTSSRSASPYHGGDAGRTIQAYHGYENNNNYVQIDSANNRNVAFGNNERSEVYGVATGPNVMQANMNNAQPAYNANVSMGYGGFSNAHDDGNMVNSSQMQHTNDSNFQQPPQQQQQQVLYMAVPTADGRGQLVLQPVQMVQLPGKPFAYVLPGQSGTMPMMKAGMDPNQSQPMMVLPNIPMQQQPMQPSNLTNNMPSGTPRHSQGRPYPSNTLEVNQYAEAPGAGMRGDGYASSFGTGGANTYSAPSDGQQDPLTSLYNTPQRPPLDALLGQVRRLSRDQIGCRLVQQALDEEGPEAATMILNEGLPFWGEAMVDPFGNYLFQKILEKITAEERIMLIKSVGSRLVNASLNLHGTRSVQKIVELCAADEERGESKDKKEGESAANILTRSLAPAAARLCIDSHGNHVIQRILLKLDHKHSKFVFDAVAESVGDVARHRHGCCVIQRCLDSAPCPARSHLVSRIVEKSLELMQDAYGNYVVQYVLDVCADEDVHAVCESVTGKVSLLAIQKFSSNVMEKCLERCTDTVREHYLNELSDPERIRELMMDPFGNYVVQRALSVATHVQAVRLVEAMRPHLTPAPPGTPNGHRNGGVRNTAGGRRIMAKICRRFPNFNLNGVGTNDELYSQNKGHSHRQQHHQQQPPPQAYGHHGSAGHQQMQQQQRYNVNPQQTMNLNIHPQYDQRQPQPYFDIGETGYFQHAPHMGNLGNGAYPNGF